jgi:hypothetical protein
MLLHAALGGSPSHVATLLQMGVQPSLELFQFMARCGSSIPDPIANALWLADYKDSMEDTAISPTFATAASKAFVRQHWHTIGRKKIVNSVTKPEEADQWIEKVRRLVSNHASSIGRQLHDLLEQDKIAAKAHFKRLGRSPSTRTAFHKVRMLA